MQAAPRFDADHQHLDDLEGPSLAARRACLGAAHIGHGRKHAGVGVVRLGIDGPDRGLRVIIEGECKVLCLLAGVTVNPLPVSISCAPTGAASNSSGNASPSTGNRSAANR